MDLVLNNDVERLIKKLKLYRAESNDLEYINTISLLVEAVEKKDKYTARHTERVTLFSLIIFDELMANKHDYECEIFKSDRAALKKAALLHDVGKVGVRTEILIKPCGLTEGEYEEIKKHSIYGYEIASFINETEEVLQAIKYHHERYDGKGYPQGLSGRDIPLLSTIIAVADTYDAMTSDRPYRKGLDREIAKTEILEQSGKQFNPEIVKAFIKVYEENIL